MLVALFIDYIILQRLPSTINQNQIPKNTGTAITVGLLAFGIFIGVTLGVTFFFQGTAFIQGTIDTSSFQTIFQSVLSNGFASLGIDEPIFADSKLLKYFEFGIVIAVIETRLIIRLWEYLSRSFDVSLERFSFRQALVMITVSLIFVAFHFQVKGVQANVPLLMTFIFAFMSLEIARRSKEMEGATYFHVINNVIFIYNKIGF